MTKHALLSASSSHRWLNCPPSARLTEDYEDVASDYAAEGTDAHTLCEYRLRQALGLPADDPIESLDWYNEGMEDCAAGYAAYITELVEQAKTTCKDPLVLTEQRVDFSQYVAEGFGTADCLIIADGTLHVVDYKHGQGVQVDAKNNSQMMLYALGALELFGCLYDIDTVSMTIFQPRRSNISTFCISVSDLYTWADGVLKPTAELAFSGGGEKNSGEWCRFCKVKNTCRKRATQNLALAQQEFAQPPLLTDDDIEAILPQLEQLIAWANDIKEYALSAAIRGRKWCGYKLVEGRANRSYTDMNAVAAIVTEAGFDPYEHSVLCVTAMQKLLGKKRFDTLLSDYIDKPQGKPMLVPESDKRPELNTANIDFMEEN